MSTKFLISRVVGLLLIPAMLSTAAMADGEQPLARPAAAVLHTSDAQRQAYLASAEIWTSRPLPSPDELRAGPPGRHPMGASAPAPDEAFPCTYLKGGTGSSGRTEKFSCRTSDGRTLRVKYYDGNPRRGNREVFAEVAATRLFWALGFDADAMFPITVQCLDCPENPMTGRGPRATRRFVGVLEAYYEGTIIGSGTTIDQGWTYDEVAAAIAALPVGSLRVRQEMYFDALVLLSSFIQHGDRKPSQQRLTCRSPLDTSAGDLHPLDEDAPLPALFERAGASACTSQALTVQDLGATFGGAGQLTPSSSKMHLDAWSRSRILALPRPGAVRLGAPTECRSGVVMAMSAEPGSGMTHVIREPGRRFLHERLAALTPAHLRALFETARVLSLDEPHTWRNPATGAVASGIEAWIAAFEAKVAELGRATCGA